MMCGTTMRPSCCRAPGRGKGLQTSRPDVSLGTKTTFQLPTSKHPIRAASESGPLSMISSKNNCQCFTRL